MTREVRWKFQNTKSKPNIAKIGQSPAEDEDEALSADEDWGAENVGPINF